MADSQSNQLILLTQASQLLANARTIEDVKQVRNVAEAARVYAKAAQMGLELQNQVAEVKLRAERKAGHFLAKLHIRGGDRKSKGRCVPLKLEDLGVSPQQSKRWQKLASVSEEDFNRFVETAALLRKEITAAGLLRLARNGRAKQVQNAKKSALINEDAGSTPSYELTELVQELRNHRELLANVLRPIYESGDIRLHTSESKAVGHLLEEMNFTLVALEKQVRRMKWLESMNGKSSG